MRKILAIILMSMLLPAPAAVVSAQSVAEAGRAMFNSGQYQSAYASLQPLAQQGDPEAVFLALVIRRNGLDGRKAADSGELARLWSALAAQRGAMENGLNNKALPEATKDAYRTALAQLEYFGPASPAWPPGPPDAERAKRGGAAERLLGSAARRFGPARNFAAFLYLEPRADRPGRAFRATLEAAEKGDFLAMGNLAWMYREGVGADKDNIRAAHWARQGCNSVPAVPRNENEVGYLYESGRGVSQDQTEALVWYEKAAAKGHPAALVNVQRLKGKSPSAPALDNRLWF